LQNFALRAMVEARNELSLGPNPRQSWRGFFVCFACYNILVNKKTSKNSAPIFSIILISITAVFLDQLSKLLVARFFPELIYKNSGIAFSIPIPAYISIVIAIFLVIAGLFAAYKFLDLSKKLAIFAISLVIGGAVGNIIDRIISGQVTDFISIWIWPVFNLADSFITIGILAIIVFYDKIKKV